MIDGKKVLRYGMIELINSEIYLLEKGVRDCALLDISEEKLGSLLEILESKHLKYVVEKGDDGWGKKLVFVYKYSHQKTMYEIASKLKGIAYHYILGKLFEYSNESIEEFLCKIKNQEQDCEAKSVKQMAREFFDITFSKETFIAFVKEGCENRQVEEWYRQNIYPRVHYNRFVSILKNCWFDKYVLGD